MQLHPIALTMRSSGTGLFERIMMTLFNKLGTLQLFFSSLHGRTRPYKAEWLVACQGILKNSSLPRRTCLFFPGSLGSLFPQWISSPCFLGWLGSPFSEASPAHSCCTLASSFLHIAFKKASPICLKLDLFRSRKFWCIISESKWVVHELCNWYPCHSASLKQTNLIPASHFAWKLYIGMPNLNLVQLVCSRSGNRSPFWLPGLHMEALIIFLALVAMFPCLDGSCRRRSGLRCLGQWWSWLSASKNKHLNKQEMFVKILVLHMLNRQRCHWIRVHVDSLELLVEQATEHVPRKNFISKIQPGQTRRKKPLPEERFQVPWDPAILDLSDCSAISSVM